MPTCVPSLPKYFALAASVSSKFSESKFSKFPPLYVLKRVSIFSTVRLVLLGISSNECLQVEMLL